MTNPAGSGGGLEAGHPGAEGLGDAGAHGVRVVLNGKGREFPAGLNVRDLLESLDLDPALVVVERNREILRRERYGEEPVEDGDVLELVHFVGGG